jgi:heme exporter protein D
MSEFFAMGGYGGYVWSSFGITAFVMLVNVFTARRAHRQMLVHLRRRAAAQQGENP